MSTETRDISPQQLREWLDAGGVTLIDVRGADEHYARRIEGATLKPLGGLTPGDLPAEGRVVIHCRSGVRGCEAVSRMARSGRGEVYNLVGGIKAWEREGHDVTIDRRVAMPIMRQVQMIAGGTVLASVILGVTVSPWTLAVAGFMGGGLLFAGASGFCGMATVLNKMPWNRAPKRGADQSVATA